jgi:microcystin synthetase protein McyG
MQKFAACTEEQTVLDRLKKGDLAGAMEDIRDTLHIEERQEGELQKLLSEILKVYRKQTGQNCSDSEYKLFWEKKPNSDLCLPRAHVPGLPAIKHLVEESLDKNTGMYPIKDFDMLISEMEAVSLHYILNAFSELGWNIEKTGLFNPREIMDTYRVIPKHYRLFYRLLRICREDGIFSNEGDLWRVGQIPEIGIDLEEWKKKFQENHPQFLEELELFHRCAINLSGVLTGKSNEIDLLFPGGDDTQIGKLYLGSPISKILNTTASNIMGFFSKDIPVDCKLRILEIGAGTGSTSSYLFPELPAENVFYTYTDISPLFIQLGKEKFKEYPFISYKCLDIGKTAVDQGFEKSGYDIIVASNVLHATPDLRACISNARKLLAPKGVIMLIEGTYEERWIDLVFGLTEGWWCFKDTDIRPEYPLVSGEMWIDLLKEAGFENVLDLCLPGNKKSFLTHQHLIVGQLPPKSAAGVGKTTVDWLIFGDSVQTCSKLIGKIQEEGENVVLVVPSEEFCLEEYEVLVYAAGAEHFGKILEDIQDKLGHILYFWPIVKGEAGGLGVEYEGLKALAKEIVKKQWIKVYRL